MMNAHELYHQHKNKIRAIGIALFIFWIVGSRACSKVSSEGQNRSDAIQNNVASQTNPMPVADGWDHIDNEKSKSKEIENLKKQLVQEREDKQAMARDITKVLEELKTIKDQKPESGLTLDQTKQIFQALMAQNEQARQMQGAMNAPALTQPDMPKGEIVKPLEPPPAYEEPSAKETMRPFVTIPIGSIVELGVINGTATLSDGGEVVINSRIRGKIETPNNGDIPLDGCHVILRADVETKDEIIVRIDFTGETLSCVFNGRVFDSEIGGWATGIDDVTGLEAKVVTNDLAAFKEFGKALIPQALAKVLDTTDTITSVGPLGSISQVADPMSSILNEISQFYIDRGRPLAASKIYTDPNRKAYFHVRKRVVMEGIYPEDLQSSRGIDRAAFN